MSKQATISTLLMRIVENTHSLLLRSLFTYFLSKICNSGTNGIIYSGHIRKNTKVIAIAIIIH